MIGSCFADDFRGLLMIWSTNPKPNQVNAIDFYTHHDPNHSMRLVHLLKFKMKFWPHDHQTVPGPSSLGATWFRCRASRTAPRLDLSFTLWLRMISGILAVQLKRQDILSLLLKKDIQFSVGPLRTQDGSSWEAHWLNVQQDLQRCHHPHCTHWLCVMCHVLLQPNNLRELAAL